MNMMICFAQVSMTEVVGVIEILVGLIAIWMAMKHASDLKSLVQVASTRYLSDFPAYLSDLARLVTKAETSIVIFCDFPAYGRFSNHRAFIEYRYALEKKKIDIDNIRIEITCLSKEQRRLAVRQQFENEFAIRSKKFSLLLEKFLADCGVTTHTAETLDLETFLDLAETANSDMLEEAFLHQHVEVDQPMHIFFWLIDGREAIFSVASRSEKALEHAFYTRDTRLIEAFESMRSLYQREQDGLKLARTA
ncbi:MAG TPA: hypothetical protein VH394_13915 [Thermoanaerobaculia bacterium]|nr:hypothetical protein [Thermoanaerobaculia bacterium]